MRSLWLDHRLRAWAVATGCLFLALIAIWLGTAYFVSADRYRPMLEGALRSATGFDARVGRLSFSLLPAPNVVAYDVAVGDDTVKVTAPRVQARLRASALFRRKLDVTSVVVSGLAVHAPSNVDALVSRIKEAVEARKQSATGKGAPLGFAVNIDHVRSKRAALYLGGADTQVLQFDFSADAVLTESMPVRLQALVPAWGPEARIEANATVNPRSGPSIQGELDLSKIDMSQALGRSWLPDLLVDMRVALDGTSLSQIAAGVSGSVTYASMPAMTGTFTAKAWWDAGTILVNDFDWTAPGLHAHGDVTRNADSTIACHLAEATANGELITALYALWPLPGATIRVQPDAEVRVSDALLGTAHSERPRFVRGAATFQGFDLLLADGTEALTGIHGQVGVEEGVLRVKEIAADGVAISGKAVPDLDTGKTEFELAGTMALSLPRLLVAVPATSIKELQGTLNFTRIAGTFDPGKHSLPEDLVIECQFEKGRVAAAWQEHAAPAVFDRVAGSLRVAKGVLSLADLNGDGLSISGSLKPDWQQRTVAIDVSGNVSLDDKRVAAFIPVSDLTGVAGSVNVKHAKATLRAGEGIPADLRVEGELRDARATLTAGIKDRLSNVSGAFTIQPGQVGHDVQGESETFGAFNTKGAYSFAKKEWRGTIACDPGRAASSLLGERASTPLVAGALASFGASSFDVSVEMGDDALSIQATRTGGSALSGKLALSRQKDAWAVSTIDVSATVPLETMTPALPPSVSASGEARVNLRHSAADTTFAAQADLTDCVLSAGDYLTKRKGGAFVVDVTGAAWKPQSAVVSCLGVAVPLRFEDDRVVARDLDVDLAPLTPLLPDGCTMGGRLKGTFASPPVDVNLTCENVAFTLGAQVSVDSISGDIAYAAGHVTCRDLTVRGANSDCTITAGQKDSVWQGKITGKKFDLNAVLAMAGAMKAFGASQDEGAPSKHGQGISGTFAVDLESAYFRRARLDNVRANVEMTPEAIHVRNLSGRPYSGALNGSVDIVPARSAAPGTIAVDVRLDSIDGRFIDGLLPEARGVTGTFTANVRLQAPNQTGEEAYAGADGEVSFAARDGSFGKMGFATHILSAFKSADFVRLRMPTFRDEGLTFTTCQGSFTIRQGFLTLNQTTLASPPFTMAAQGTVDFPRRNTNVLVNVSLLETAANATERIPLVGGALSAAASVTGVELHVEGSPYRPTVRVQPLRRAAGIPKKVGEKAIDLLDKTIDRIRNR